MSVRIHALDHLRALMMWLGIVLHVCVNYTSRQQVLPWADVDRTPLADLLLGFIHAFRMPLFFMIAGFFAAQLLAQRGPGGLARHRLRRLGLPFLVFWPPLYLACALLALVFLHRLAHGNWGMDFAVVPPGPGVAKRLSTLHLWFLWMLLWYCLAAAALARLLPPAVWEWPARQLHRLAASTWGPAVLALPLVLAGLGYKHGLLQPGGDFLPPWNEWLHNGIFFAYGLAMHRHREEAWGWHMAHWRLQAEVGALAVLLTGLLVSLQAPAVVIALSYNLGAWLCSFALLGWGLRKLASPRPWLAYLADSAYWVYLVHLPLTMAFAVLMLGLPLPPEIKILVGIVGTTVLCLASYQFLVRSSWIGLLLNGRRHPRRGADRVATAAP